MKISSALLALICIVVIHSGCSHNIHLESTPDLKAQLDECARTNNLDKSVLDDIWQGKDPAESRNLDCFLACVLKRNDIMNADGSINRKLNDSDAIKKCKDLKGKDECETAGKVAECYDDNKLQIFN